MATPEHNEDATGSEGGEGARRALLIKGDAHAGPYPVLQISDQSLWVAGDVPFGIGESVTILFVAGQPSHCVEAEVARVERGAGQARCQLTLRHTDQVRVPVLEPERPPSAPPSARDRRRFRRFRVPSSAVVMTGQRYVGTYVTRNLSAGGALLVGDSNLAVGQHVRLLLHVVGKFSQTLEADVVRREQLPSGEQSFAVAFTGQDAETNDGLRRLTMLASEASAKKPPHVLLLSQAPGRVAAMEAELGALGFDVVTVLTPLDAVSYLSSEAQPVAAVMVSCDRDHSDGLGLLEFVKDAHPAVRRLALVNDTRPSDLDRHTADGSVETVVQHPWDRELLSRALRPLQS